MAAAPVWLCDDPGETTGYSIWQGKKLIWADQMPMWEHADAIYKWAATGDYSALGDFELEGDGRLTAIVCEQWQLYPWELQNLAWDECRTARLIGAMTLTCRQFGIKLIFQGADIKKGAQAAGAESLYLEPVHENRHANDSIQHGVFYLATHRGKAP